MRFGKLPVKHDYRNLRLKSYLTPLLAAPPEDCDSLRRVYQKLGMLSPTELFPMDGNDRYGDCTIAALAHAITVYRGLVGKRQITPEQSVIDLYLKLSGGSDSGLFELDVLNYWRKQAVDGESIRAYVSVDPKNRTQVKQAIQLFGGLYIGFQVQENCIEQFQERRPWLPGRLSDSGHAVFVVAYNNDEVAVLTWGDTQRATWGWWDECVDEAYAILPEDAQQADFTPGFDFAQLEADLAAL